MAASLTDVVNELKQQSNTLDSVKDYLADEANIRAQQAKADALAAKKKLESDREAAAKANINDGPQGLFAGVKAGMLEASGLGAAGGLFGWLKGFMAPLLGTVFGTLFGGMSLATLAGRIGKMVGRGLIFGPAILLLESFGKDIMYDLLTQLREVSPDWLKLSDGALRTVGDGIIDSLNTGLLFGIFFGKKGFIAGFLGNILASSVKWLTGQPQEYWDQNFNFAGMEFPFSNDTVLLMGSTLAAYFGPSLLYGAVTKAFGGTALAYPGANVGRNKKGQFMKLKPAHQTSFRSAFAGRFGAGIILNAVGGALANYITNEFGDEAGNAADWTVSGMTIGYILGGPIGALIGGMVFLAAVGLKALGDWLRNQDEKIRNKIVSDADDILARQQAGENIDPEEIAAKTSAAAEELNRFANPVGGLIQGAGNKEALYRMFGMNVATLEARGNMGQAYRERAAYALASGDYAEAVRSAAASLKEYGEEVTPEAIDMLLSKALTRARTYGGLKQYEITELMTSKGQLTSDKLNKILSSAPLPTPMIQTDPSAPLPTPKIQMDPYMDVNKAAAFNQGVTLTPVINSGNQTSVSTSNYNFRSEVLDPYDLMRTTPATGMVMSILN